MTKEEVADRVVSLIRQRDRCASMTVTAQSRLEEISLDSIDLVYLLAHFEREHDADFDDTYFDLSRYDVVDDLIDAVCTRVNA
jgi:acyl carrier protein